MRTSPRPRPPVPRPERRGEGRGGPAGRPARPNQPGTRSRLGTRRGRPRGPRPGGGAAAAHRPSPSAPEARPGPAPSRAVQGPRAGCERPGARGCAADAGRWEGSAAKWRRPSPSAGGRSPPRRRRRAGRREGGPGAACPRRVLYPEGFSRSREPPSLAGAEQAPAASGFSPGRTELLAATCPRPGPGPGPGPGPAARRCLSAGVRRLRAEPPLTRGATTAPRLQQRPARGSPALICPSQGCRPPLALGR